MLDDGSVRVWRDYDRGKLTSGKLELVTAWQALSGMLPSTRGEICNKKRLKGKIAREGTRRNWIILLVVATDDDIPRSISSFFAR